MTTINIDTGTLLRALMGDEDALKEIEALLPTPRPTTGLLGRWAKHPRFEDVLITDDTPVHGSVVVAYPDSEQVDGAREMWVPLEDLTFPEQTTDPEDVPPGEAWLVEADGNQFNAIKDLDEVWFVPGVGRYWWCSSSVTLISPLVPVRPTDGGEWVETKEEYEALPEGSVVAFDGNIPRIYNEGLFRYGTSSSSADFLAGGRRRVLRRGWGE